MAREGEAHDGPRSLGGGNGLSVEGDEWRRRLDSASQQLVAFVRQHPLQSLAGALVAGFFLGRLAARRY